MPKVELNSSTIRLDAGRWIELDSLNQFHTYAGLLEGLPSRALNKEIIAGIVKKGGGLTAPFVIQPKERLGKIAGGKNEHSRFWSLPKICCVGDFRSDPLSPKHVDESMLTIIWFQDTFAFPIAEAALKEIKKIPWNRRAGEFSW